jgi:hypothetical protein
MLVALIFSTVLVVACVLIHYEVLRLTSTLLGRLTIPPRPRILVVMFAVFLAHTIEVWVYAIAYYLLRDHLGIGGFGGTLENQFTDYLYFSTATYSSLGYGDVYPLGGLRLVAGIETVAGLVMIGWSASFTYLTMEKFWGLHGPRTGR